MLCPVCGSYATDEEIVCPACGKLLERERSEDEALLNFRQGRHLRDEQVEPPRPETPGSSGASRSFEDTRPPENPQSTAAFYGQQEVLSDTGRIFGEDTELVLATQSANRPVVMRQRTRTSRVQRHASHRRMVNWAYVIIAVILAVVIAFGGFIVMLKATDDGARCVAKTGIFGFEPTAEAMWEVGEEYLTVSGDVELAIEYFVKAREMDGEDNPNKAGLLLLGDAYERWGDVAKAEEVYTYVYTEVEKNTPEAYDSLVRILLDQGRKAEAALLLETAYQNTQQARYRTQRKDVLPHLPYASVIAGYYTEKKTVELLHEDDCAIYYTTDLYAELPLGGTLYTGPLELGEGEHRIRAVAVEGDLNSEQCLVSDEMQAVYQIYMPTPLQPDCNLAPNTYEKRRTVKLWPGKLSDEELEKNPGYAATLKDPVAQDITIYYTIDGSRPDADSPIFDGEAITLPAGRVTLRAVSVNGYDKEGNMLEVTYKFNIKPALKAMYSTADTIGTLKLGTTTREEFQGKYGKASSVETTWIFGVDGDCEKHVYPWGYAAFMKSKTGFVLADLYFTDNTFSGPRSTGIGSTETQVTEQFKDFGQVVGATGRKRGLYQDESKRGVIYIAESGEKTIVYRVDTESHIWQLTYSLNAAGRVTSIRWQYEP